MVISKNTTIDEEVEINASVIIIVIGLSLIILATFFGNILTLTAICKHRPLQTPPNYLIASLAIADLMVAIVVMPLSLTKEVTVIWMFGRVLCDLWISLDVLCCTASILSLCMISLDRFWAITTAVRYQKYRTPRTMLILIAVVWFVASLISTSPLFGWNGNQEIDPKICQINESIAFTIFSTFFAFFIPMTIMMIVYGKIFCEARKRIRGRKFNTEATLYLHGMSFNGSHRGFLAETSYQVVTCATTAVIQANLTNGSTTLSTNGISSSAQQAQEKCDSNKEPQKAALMTSLLVPGQDPTQVSLALKEINANETPSKQALLSTPTHPNSLLERERKRRATANAREHRAAKTLGIVTGAFLICWLPFSLKALILPLCKDACHLPHVWHSIFLWLGYFNSMCNPIIYTKFNRDFQKAFKKLLNCKDNKQIP